MADYEKTIIVRITKRDNDKIRQIATSHGLKVSELLRKLIKDRINQE